MAAAGRAGWTNAAINVIAGKSGTAGHAVTKDAQGDPDLDDDDPDDPSDDDDDDEDSIPRELL
ncbi:hypothetical protein ISF_02289 [Cordyceps fumosorosea ARSEF 2679]|uniref:Uncharacterized protein n=1 Tax=Cordyceps fumosorosea (strain ARSEF 2679) TaxID=1081104 RepID=A0A168BML9_CORFA|nr:hypothetical protein ISF_02289 [Cordyceps fumosorosea ARSEF 2679]OAA70315.1 hypothetical protein ISF_02289 [Cordyceps fumosorosea ARSEF 2679]